MRRVAVGLAVAILAAAAVRAGSVEVEFDPGAEFERYRTWAFAPGHDERKHGVLADATMRDRVEKALAANLGRAGLRPATQDAAPDVLVRYGGDIGLGKTVTTHDGYFDGGLAPVYSTTRYDEQFATLIVDLVDASSRSLVWRLYLNQKFGGPNDPPDKLRRALEKGFSKYPPSASARARRARAIGKGSGAR